MFALCGWKNWKEVIRIKEVTNCPNCGAPITGARCEYCGTMLVDFAAIKSDGPFWMKFNLRGQTFMAKVVLAEMESCSTPEFYTMPGGPDGIRAYSSMDHTIIATFKVVE